MATFEEAMQLIINQAESLSTKMSVEDKAEVTKAGAKVFEQALAYEVRNRHYRHRDTGEDPHLADSIVMKNKNIDGVKDGQSVVGWERSTEKVLIQKVISLILLITVVVFLSLQHALEESTKSLVKLQFMQIILLKKQE